MYAYVLYVFQIAYMAIFMSVAILGMMLRKDRDPSIAKKLEKYIVKSLIVHIVFVIISFYLSEVYISKLALYYSNSQQASDLTKVPSILLLITSILAILFEATLTWKVRKIYRKFKSVLQKNRDFLLFFEETPRSKFAKKYLPPMAVLHEEQSQLDLTQQSVSVKIYQQYMAKKS